MPDIKTHCQSSISRTNKSFEDLHKWMDEGQRYLDKDHRFERHSTSYIPYVKEKWGTEGIKEFLRHIIEDYEHTLKMYEGKCVVCNKPTWKGKKLCITCYNKLKKKS